MSAQLPIDLVSPIQIEQRPTGGFFAQSPVLADADILKYVIGRGGKGLKDIAHFTGADSIWFDNDTQHFKVWAKNEHSVYDSMWYLAEAVNNAVAAASVQIATPKQNKARISYKKAHAPSPTPTLFDFIDKKLASH
jgi:hypothetical protein